MIIWLSPRPNLSDSSRDACHDSEVGSWKPPLARLLVPPHRLVRELEPRPLGANVHWPTASLNSSATEDISSSLRKLIHDAREDLWQRRRGQHDP